MTEPEDGAIVAWFDPHGDIYAVRQRNDRAEPGWSCNWYSPVADDLDPLDWQGVLDEYRGLRGPCLLESQGRVM